MSEDTQTIDPNSDTYKQAPAEKLWPALPPVIEVERNGVKLAFSIKKPSRIKPGKDGKVPTPVPFYSPTLEEKTLSTITAWFGINTILTYLQGKINSVCQAWSREHIAISGQKMDVEGWTKSAQEMSTRGLAVSELQEQLSNITEQMIKLTQDKDADPVQMMQRMAEYGAQMRDIQEQISSRKRSK